MVLYLAVAGGRSAHHLFHLVTGQRNSIPWACLHPLNQNPCRGHRTAFPTRKLPGLCSTAQAPCPESSGSISWRGPAGEH
jgi:hypothetical protein